MSETSTRELSPAETLALRAQQGDDDAAAQLVRDHAPLAFKLGQRYRHAVGEENDWRQLCCLALLVAARRWQPDRAAFSTYVGLTVRYTFGRHFRSARWFGGPQNDPATRRTPTRSLDEPISADEPAAGTLADLLQADARTDPYALACAAETRRGVALALQRITPQERRVLLARAGYGNAGKPVPLAALGAALGTSRNSARQVERRALVKLQRVTRGVGR